MNSVIALRTLLKALTHYSYEIIVLVCAADERECNWGCQPLLMINVTSSVRHTQNVEVSEKVDEAAYTKYPSEKVIELIEQL